VLFLGWGVNRRTREAQSKNCRKGRGGKKNGLQVHQGEKEEDNHEKGTGELCGGWPGNSKRRTGDGPENQMKLQVTGQVGGEGRG